MLKAIVARFKKQRKEVIREIYDQGFTNFFEKNPYGKGTPEHASWEAGRKAGLDGEAYIW